MEPLVSIIIPTYQNEAYITRCLQSVLKQTYRHYEIIIIDDGSTDRTKEVLEQYIADPKVKYVFKENGGLSDARNTGMQSANGTYIYFLDSDDWIEPQYIEKMVQRAKQTDADIVLSSIVITDGEKETLRSDSLESISDENVRNFYTPFHFHPIMQNKLFHRRLIIEQKLRFPTGLYYEDVYFFTCAFEKASVVVRSQDALFYYFQHDHSIMKQTSKKLLDIEAIFHLLMEEYPHFENESWFEYMCVRHLYFASTLRTIKGKNGQLLKEVIQSHDMFIQRFFPNWQKNPFLTQRYLYQARGQYVYARILKRFGYRVAVSIARYIF